MSASLGQGFWEAVKGSFVLLDFLAPDRFFDHSREAVGSPPPCRTQLALSTRYALMSNDLDGLIPYVALF